MKPPREKPVHVFLKNAGRNRYNLAIALYKAKPPAPSQDLRVWKFADFDIKFPYEFNCEGFKLRPRMILKIYCKMSGKMRRDALRRMALRKLREGSPFIMPD